MIWLGVEFRIITLELQGLAGDLVVVLQITKAMISSSVLTLLGFLCLLQCLGCTYAFNATELTMKLEAQRNSAREAINKIEETLRESRKRHDEQMRKSREAMEKAHTSSVGRRKPVKEGVEELEEVTVAADGARENIPPQPPNAPATSSVTATSPDNNTGRASSSLEAKKSGGTDSPKSPRDSVPPRNMAESSPQRKEETFDAVKRPIRSHQILQAHNIPESLVDEINRMAASLIPREAIVQHIASHYPAKKIHELNDIVIAAVAIKDKTIPDTTDTKHATKETTAFHSTKFERSQASFEERKKELLKQRG